MINKINKLSILLFGVFSCFSFVGQTTASDAILFDLQGQIVATQHTDIETTIEIAVRTRQDFSYPFATTIIVACYDAKQYDTRRTKISETSLAIQGISSTTSVYTTLTIPKKDVVQTILCHIDDTNVVRETNDSNQVGWVHVDARTSKTSTDHKPRRDIPIIIDTPLVSPNDGPIIPLPGYYPKPIIKEKPIVREKPISRSDDLSPCYGRDCSENQSAKKCHSQSPLEPVRRIVYPTAINTTFKRMEWLR